MGDGKIAWQKNGTPNTLTGNADSITITDLTSRKFNEILTHVFDNGSLIELYIRLGSGGIESGSVYSVRRSLNGAADTVFNSQTHIQLFNPDVADMFSVTDIINIAAEEKLVISHTVTENLTGVGNAPSRLEGASKWTNVANQFDQIQVEDSGAAGQYETDSNLSALGTD